jgi:putative acyl-CoA dehydrogenase
VDALLTEIDIGDARLAPSVSALRAELASPSPSRARWLAEQVALCLQASLLVRHAPPAVADAFVVSRLDAAGGRTFGILPRAVPARALVDRITPHP